MQKISAAKIDLYIFKLINGQTKKSRVLDLFGIWCAEYAGYLFLVFVLALALAAGNWQLFLIPVLAGLFCRFVLAEAVYFFYQRKRPLEVLTISTLIKKPHHPAFPSGHASFFFAFSFALFLFSIPLALTAITITCIVCLSRIFCGVHWPSDILAGAGVGLVTYLLLYLV